MSDLDGRDAASFLVILLLLGALVVGARRGRLFIALVVMLAALGAGWAAAAVAVRADYRDADGCVDCWPDCTTFQDAVAGMLFHGPVATVVLLVATAGALLVRRRRSAEMVLNCSNGSRQLAHQRPGGTGWGRRCSPGASSG